MKQIFSILVCSLVLFGCRNETGNGQTNVGQEDQDSQREINGDTANVEINPISHATMVINWDDTTIYVDPVGGAEAFEGYDEADLVLITDIHQDHMDPETLNALNLGDTRIIVPEAVKEELPDTLDQNLIVMDNGETIERQGISIEAIPMYNLREEAKEYHPEGRGNGYLLEKNGTRVYIAGDTEDIPEMRNLEDIDIAFIPMNLPYTMPVEAAADAVLDFEPDRVYPYHFRGQDGKADVEEFRRLVNEGNPEIEVVLAEWYPEDSEQ